MRIRRKTQNCLNCGHTLDQIYHYCPRCGQENNHRMVSFGELIKDFFVNYFSFDTKFARSTKPFLFAPGELTRLFISGKRASYVNPLRLYIIVSVIFFFLSTLLVKESLQNAGVELIQQDQQTSVSFEAQSDTLQSQNFGFDLKQFSELLADETLTDQQVLDSLNTFSNLEFNISQGIGQHIFRQLRKVARQDLEIFTAYVLQNMPIMMFLLLPVFALILKLLFIRRGVLYVKHLIHGIHLHAFVFFLLTPLLIMYLIFDVPSGVGNYVEIAINLLLLLYVFLSMLRVYGQHWFKTLIKFTILIVVYFFVFIIFGLSETLISFLIF